MRGLVRPTRSAAARKFQRVVHDSRRRLWPRQSRGRLSHSSPPRRIPDQRQDLIGQPIAGQIPLIDHLDGPFTPQLFRVLPLVIVGGCRKWYQNRRAPCCGELGQCRRTRAAHKQVGTLSFHDPFHKRRARRARRDRTVEMPRGLISRSFSPV